MANNIIIYLDDQQLEKIHWVLVDDGGNAIGEPQTGTLEEAAPQVDGGKLSVVLPGDWVMLISAQVPGGSQSRALKAVPFVLEESLAEDIESLHFALGDKTTADEYPVAVVSRALMDTMQEKFLQVGIRPTHMVVDAQALPLFEGEQAWTAYLDNNLMILRESVYQGYSLEADNAVFMLSHRLNESKENAPEKLIVYRSDENAPALALPGQDIDIQYYDCVHLLGLFGEGLKNTKAINLLQGDYSYKQQFDKVWKPWRPALALAAALMLLFGAGKFLQLQDLITHDVALRIEMENVLKRTFPQIRRIVQPRKQMKSEMAKLGATSAGLVTTIEIVASGVLEAGDTNLNAISYRKGRLDLQLDTDALPTLDKLKKLLEKDGKLAMTIQSANREDGRIRSRVRVEIKG